MIDPTHTEEQPQPKPAKRVGHPVFLHRAQTGEFSSMTLGKAILQNSRVDLLGCVRVSIFQNALAHLAQQAKSASGVARSRNLMRG